MPEYNGWYNYATWRINLELVDADSLYDCFEEKPDGYALADTIREDVTEYVCGEDYNAEKLATQYALAFIDDVNFDEIADIILADWPEDEDEEEDA